MRYVFVLMLLVIGVSGARAEMISVAGGAKFDVIITDAKRDDALAALFGATQGVRMMAVRDEVTGRIVRLRLAQVTFDDALTAILGTDYRYERARSGNGWVYTIINPSVVRKPARVLGPTLLPSGGLPVVDLALLPLFPAGEGVSRDQSPVLRYRTIDTSRLAPGLSGMTGSTVMRRTTGTPGRRAPGIHYTESIPIVVMSETRDVFGNTLRQPQIYWQTFGVGLDINGINLTSGGILPGFTPGGGLLYEERGRTNTTADTGL